MISRGVLLVVSLGMVGCGAMPLSPLQRSALLQRISDEGNTAVAAVQARDRALQALAKMQGQPARPDDTATVTFLGGENAALRSDVAAALR